VANIVPTRYFGPATADFQRWLRNETINFLEADLLHWEHRRPKEMPSMNLERMEYASTASRMPMAVHEAS
jgi:hypothetical protein